MPDPFDLRTAHPDFVPVETERLLFAGIGAVVRHEALAGHQIEASIAVEIDQRGRVSLRPCVIDRATRPRTVLDMLEPENTVVVTGCRDPVVAAVAVHVEYMHEAELGEARLRRRRRRR